MGNIPWPGQSLVARSVRGDDGNSHHAPQRKMRHVWYKICHPEGIHTWRWRALTLWVVVFSILVAVAFKQQSNESQANDTRFCEVTKAFIGINIDIQSELNRQTIKQLGTNQKIVRVTSKQLSASKAVLRNMPRKPVAYYTSLRRFLKSTQQFLETSQELSAGVNESSRRLLKRRLASINQARILRRRLKCAD